MYNICICEVYWVLDFRVVIRFQISLTRVFEQFLSRIIFSSTAEIHKDLIGKLIGLFGLWRDGQYHRITSDVNLFLEKKLHPSPGLLCIIFGFILRLGFVLYSFLSVDKGYSPVKMCIFCSISVSAHICTLYLCLLLVETRKHKISS